MARKAKTFGDALKQARLSRDLTQDLLSIKTGIAAKQISNFETGTRKPAYDNLQKLRKALGCSWEELLG